MWKDHRSYNFFHTDLIHKTVSIISLSTSVKQQIALADEDCSSYEAI